MGSEIYLAHFVSYCSAPTVVIIFYFISYHIFYAANSMLSNGRILLPVKQTGRPDHLSFT